MTLPTTSLSYGWRPTMFDFILHALACVIFVSLVIASQLIRR